MAKRVIPDPVSSVETFNDVRGYWLHNIVHKEPSCCNGNVSVHRWRVTVEKIDEPVEVIAERLETLYRQSDNHHHYEPLVRAAESIGYVFTGKFGQDKKQR